MVLIEGRHTLHVLIQDIHAQNTGTGQPGNPPGTGGGLDGVAQFAVGEALVASEGDFADDHLFALVYVESDTGSAPVVAVHAALHVRVVVTLGLVEGTDLFHRLVDLGRVEDRVGANARRFANLRPLKHGTYQHN